MFDPRSDRADFTSRTERAVAEIGMYRTVAYKDLSEAHFEGHPYATRRAVDRMIQQGDVGEHAAKGPQGGTYKVLTLTEKGIHRAEVAARAQGLEGGQKAWSGRVKSAELQHDTVVFRAARVEQGKLIEQGAVLKRVRIDAELKREVARASETARVKGGKEEADAARVEKAAELGLPVKAGKVEYPDAQLEYDLDGRSGRVNVEIATEHYSAKSIGAKAAAASTDLLAQGTSPWLQAIDVLQQAFTGPIARGLSLIAIVVGGLMFAFGEGGSKKALAGIVFGLGMAMGAANFLAWLF